MTGPSPRSSAVAAGPQSSAMRTGDIVADPDIDDVQKRLDGALEALRREFQGLRTGRASIGLLEPLTVEAYGAKVPTAQVGTLGVPESRIITLQVRDKGGAAATETEILHAHRAPHPTPARSGGGRGNRV